MEKGLKNVSTLMACSCHCKFNLEGSEQTIQGINQKKQNINLKINSLKCEQVTVAVKEKLEDAKNSSSCGKIMNAYYQTDQVYNP